MPHESTQGLGLTFEDFGPNLSQSRRQMICSCSLLAVPIFFSSWPLGLPSASTLLAMLYVPIRPCSFNWQRCPRAENRANMTSGNGMPVFHHTRYEPGYELPHKMQDSVCASSHRSNLFILETSGWEKGSHQIPRSLAKPRDSMHDCSHPQSQCPVSPSSRQAVLDGTVIRNTTQTPAHRSREHK